MAFKALVAVAIPDVPETVLLDEVKREKTTDMAKHHMLIHKMESGHETFGDVVQRLQGELTKEMEDEMTRHNKAVNAGGKKRYVTYNYEEKFQGLQAKAMLTIIEK